MGYDDANNYRKGNIMDVTQYIEKLKKLQKEFGNLECIDARGNPMPNPEFNDDNPDEGPCFVLAEDG